MIDDLFFEDMYDEKSSVEIHHKSYEPTVPYVSPDETWEDPHYSNPE